MEQEVLLERAANLIREGMFVKAIELLESASPDYYVDYLMGLSLRGLGSIIEAYQSFQESFSKEPAFADNLRELILCQLNLGEISAANQNFKHYRRLERDKISVVLTEIEVQRSQGNEEKARGLAREAVTMQITSFEQIGILFRALLDFDLIKEAEHLWTTYQHEDTQEYFKKRLSLYLMDKRDYEKAKLLLHSVASSNQDFLYFHYLGRVYAMLSQFEVAIKYIAKAGQLAPANQDNLDLLKFCLEGSGDIDQYNQIQEAIDRRAGQ